MTKWSKNGAWSLLFIIGDKPGSTEAELRVASRDYHEDDYNGRFVGEGLKQLKRDGLAEKYRQPGSTSEKPHVWRLTDGGEEILSEIRPRRRV